MNRLADIEVLPSEVDFGIYQEMRDFTALHITAAATVILTDTNAGALQSAINSADDGDIIEVQSNATYSPIVLPVDKELIIRSGIGYMPKISGQKAVTISDGTRDILVAGFSFPSCSTDNANYNGAVVCLEHEGKFENVLFYQCAFPEVVGGSAILLSYHKSIGGDDYATTPTYPDDFSSRFGVLNCDFFHACKDGTEGAAIACRAIEHLYVKGCRVNGNAVSSRGIQAQNCKNIMIVGNKLHNFGSGNSEAIKLDRIGSLTDLTTGLILNNIVWDCVEGIDIDDYASAFIQGNLCYNCADEGISVDGDGSSAVIFGNIVHNCKDGIRAEAGALVDLRNNCSFNNSSNDYRMDNGYSQDSSNLTTPIDDGRSAVLLHYNPTTVSDWDTTPKNIKEALDELASRVTVLEP